MGAWMTRSESARWAAVDSAVEAEAAAAFAFLERLVAAPSTVAAERAAQEIVAAELAGQGSEVSEFEVPAQTPAAPPGGVAQRPYRGRPNVLGQLPADHWLAESMARAHLSATGAAARRAPIGATTDARYHLNQFGVPALAYGPRARNIHGTAEAVELASIVIGAKTLARFMAAFYAGEVIPA